MTPDTNARSLDTNALVAALAQAVIVCEPGRRYESACACGDRECPEARTSDLLARALTSVCALLGLPAPGPLRSEMEWEQVAMWLATAAHEFARARAFAGHAELADEQRRLGLISVHDALSLACAPADGRETGAGGGR
jgi:hypothetical protein